MIRSLSQEHEDREAGAEERFEHLIWKGLRLHRLLQDAREHGACVIDVDCDRGSPRANLIEHVLLELVEARDELDGRAAALLDRTQQHVELFRVIIQEQQDGALISRTHEAL